MDHFVQSLMERFGAFGIGLLMFLENIFPPIPSEIIMPLAGYQAATGQMSIVTVIVAGTVGAVLGIIPWYLIGRAFGAERVIALAERFGRWLTLSPSDVASADRWFQKHGYWAVVVGRLVPTVRTLISVPAGLARMPFLVFIALSTIGTAFWTAGLAFAGYFLGQNYEAIDGYIGPVSNAIVIGIVVLYIYRFVTFDPKHDVRASDIKSDDLPHRHD